MIKVFQEVSRAGEYKPLAEASLFGEAETSTPLWDVPRARLSADRLIARCRAKLPALAAVECALGRLTERCCTVQDYRLLREVAHRKVAMWKIERLFLLTQLIRALEQVSVKKGPR